MAVMAKYYSRDCKIDMKRENRVSGKDMENLLAIVQVPILVAQTPLVATMPATNPNSTVNARAEILENPHGD